MIETLTIITLSVLFLIFFRPGKTPPLDNPLVIERPGQYHMTLAPQLNLAQPFIEAVAQQIGAPGDAELSGATQCFEVRDKQATAHGHDCYLLSITRRNGMLYFRAAGPQADEQAPPEASGGQAVARITDADRRIAVSVQEVARMRGVNIKQLIV
jgi:hypothetical protein